MEGREGKKDGKKEKHKTRGLELTPFRLLELTLYQGKGSSKKRQRKEKKKKKETK